MPFLLLTLAVGLFYLRLGWIAATLTEGEVIARYAARYVTTLSENHPDEKASQADCLAVPGDERGVWLVIICGDNPCDRARYFEYHVNRVGGFVHGGDPACPDARLQRYVT